MLIGVDFDNTIVSYDALFHRVARERGVIPADLPVNKTAVRDYLRKIGQEDIWTEMQGQVYGARMSEAEPFPGVAAFFAACRDRGIRVVIISHKTRYPFLGEKHDLHAAASAWLKQQGFISGPADAVFFELTKADKLARIAAIGCTHFIDDLPEILGDLAFPPTVQKILFDPLGAVSSPCPSARSWLELAELLLDENGWQRAAAAIVSNAGNATGCVAEPLTGGANNRVYRVTSAGAAPVLVKRYFRHAGDRRDRYAAEKAFYTYAAAAGVTHIPQALGWNPLHQIGVFTFIAGERPRVASAEHLDAALEFLRVLNSRRTDPLASQLAPASEACFSLGAHLGTVRRRVEDLSTALGDDSIDTTARRLIAESLKPAWEAVQSDINHRSDGLLAEQELSLAERCLSPSDFGFHNSLLTDDGRLFFFDFEYAGWDDPAKLVCDFFCQPEIPVPIAGFDRFTERFAALLGLSNTDAFAARCRTLLPVYRIKWSCILLNEFTTVGRSRRNFALGAAEAGARRVRQLERARRLLAEVPVPA